MDITHFKQLAKLLHSFLKPQLGPAFKLGQAQELMAILAGLRSWSEVLSFPDRLKTVTLDESSLSRIADRIEQQYAAKVSHEGLYDALVPPPKNAFVNAPRPAIVCGRIPPRWICDACGSYIDSVDSAYVVWKGSGTTNHTFRIIHQSRCDVDNSFSKSNPLRDYVGQEGLNKLLSFLSDGPIIQHLHPQLRPRGSNVDEIVHFIRRCQIPNYDLARALFTDPRVIEEFHSSTEYAPYQPDTLARIVREFGEIME